jgi:DNA-binding MarR family transcriptional regulator
MTTIGTLIVATPTDVEAPAPFLGPLLKRAQRTSAKVLRQQLESLGLTPAQFGALRELYGRDGLSLGEIARGLNADPPTMSGVVDLLVNAGYVERREDAQDRRKLRLFLTERARSIEGELAQIEERREQALARVFKPDELGMLKQLLGRLCVADESCAGSE